MKGIRGTSRTTRVWLVLASAVLVAGAGCSRDDGDASGGDGTATTSASGTASGSGTTARASGAPSSTSRPASTSSGVPLTTTTRPASSLSSTTTRPASSTASTSTTAIAPPTGCGNVAGGGPGGDTASGITATGVSCGDATALVQQVRAGHNFYDGPRSFNMGGYSCTVVTETTGLPVGHYSCKSGTKTVTWDKT